MKQVSCRHFTGYRPCEKNIVCDCNCPSKSTPSIYLLIIHLGASGSVARSTALLPSLHRKYPDCHITWITDPPNQWILQNNGLIDQILTTSARDLLKLKALSFDFCFCLDKSLEAFGIINSSRCQKIFGFKGEGPRGACVPAQKLSETLWNLGLDNHAKFFLNKKTELELVAEVCGLKEFFGRDEYVIQLTADEQALSEQRRHQWIRHRRKSIVVGINTGCGAIIAYKKLSVDMHRQLIEDLEKLKCVQVVLLGGPSEELQNAVIASGLPALQSPTTGGLRDGIISVQACDLIISGDSLGMHLGIGLKKWVIAWFGPTCSHEVDLYDRGVKVVSPANCSPCWKRMCKNNPMCYDLVKTQEIIRGVQQGIQWHQQTSLFKQPSSAICSSASL